MSNDDPQTLKDVAQAALDNNRGMSGRSLDAEAKRRGLSIVYTTINHMVAGTYKSKPGKKTLEALAALSGYSIEQVYRAAKLPMPMRPLADDLPPDSDLLTGPQRRLVIDTVRLFAQQNRALHESEARAKVGGDSGTQASTQKINDGGGEVIEGNFGGPDPAELIDDLAADRPGTPSEGQLVREDQDKVEDEDQDPEQ